MSLTIHYNDLRTHAYYVYANGRRSAFILYEKTLHTNYTSYKF